MEDDGFYFYLVILLAIYRTRGRGAILLGGIILYNVWKKTCVLLQHSMFLT